MKILCFTENDELKEIKVQKVNDIAEVLKDIEETPMKRLHLWTHDNITLECYGCDTNEMKRKINPHCLPPSETTYTLYGNVYLVQKINENFTDLDISQYGMLSYYIQEKYENLEQDYEYITGTDEELEIQEETQGEILTKKINLPGKNKVKSEDSKQLYELEYDTTNY